MKFSKYNVFYEHGDNFLLVNTRTGAMFTLDGELKQKIESGDVSCIRVYLEDVVKEYTKTGMVIDDSFDEYNFLKYITDKESGLSKENFFTIDADGSVYKCWELVGNKDYIVGYINETGCMVDITSYYYDCIARDADRIEECRNCVYLPLCCCGCASVSIQKNSSIFTPGCFKTKSIFFEQAKLFLAKKKLA